MESKGSFCRLHLRVKACTRAGQFVGVTGLLGGADSKGHVRLVTTPESYPIWYTSNPIVVPRNELVHYKYCVLEGGSVKAVERNSAPRMLIPEDTDIVLEDEFHLHFLEGSKFDTESDFFEGNASAGNLNATPVTGTHKRRTSEHEGKSDWARFAQRNSRLFLICYHLPVNIKRTNRMNEPFEAIWAESLIAKSAGSVSGSIKTIWIGTVNVSVSDLTPAEKDYIIILLRNMDCIPVFLDDEVAAKAYYGFCKTIMWPVFHNVDQLDQIHAAWNLPSDYDTQRGFPTTMGTTSSGGGGGGGNRSRSGSLTPAELLGSTTSISSENKVLEWNKKEVEYHEAFQTVNQIFAKTVMEFVRDGDIAWIHDYHLMLVPQLLRDWIQKSTATTKDLKIVFFLHIPFPTSQIFRTLPEASELIQSMVSADLVGFHAFDHARHFLNAAKRMLGIRSYTKQGGMLTLGVQDREVIVTMSHVSIETDRVDAALQHPETARLSQEIQDKYKNMKIIVGIDVCQRLSGLALKMLAFDKLAADYVSSERGGLVLIQRCIRQGSRMEDEETTSNDVKKMVADINAKYANNKQSPIFVDYAEIENFKGVPLQERIALYLSADVFLITPIREGLNLLPLEYIYARKNLARAGSVIVSEFSTCSSLLNGSLKVNPFSPVAVADAIEKALSMSTKDCEYRKQRDMPFIVSHPSSLWTKQILNELEQLQSKIGHGSVSAVKLSEPLNTQMLIHAYEQTAKDAGICQVGSRVFIFDYGGALLHKEKYDIYMKQTLSAISGRKPSPLVMEALKRLSEDPKNIVMVITGLARMKLGETFKGLANVAIATSNGLIYSWGNTLSSSGHKTKSSAAASSSSSATSLLCSNNNTITNAVGKDSLMSDDGRQWECMDCNIDWNAVSEIASPIITKFTFRTNGTCKTPRFPGIGWSYFGADPDWGRKQAVQLKLELEAALANFDVKITSLVPGSIEVVPKTLKKGMIVSKLLQKIVAMRGGRLPGMVTVMGAEEADDGMTQAVLDTVRDSPVQGELDRMKAFTIAVGKRDSTSQFYINDIKDVENLLNTINNLSSSMSNQLTVDTH